MPFQVEAWQAFLNGSNGMVNAPTGSGKTFSLLIPAMLESLLKFKEANGEKGLQLIWITPIRALSKEIELAANRAVQGLGLNWQVKVRTGDTTTKEREQIRKRPPELLITTPESLHLMLASKNYAKLFKNLSAIVCDEWHELVGSKRGVLMELALSRLKTVVPALKIWGISATIGNMHQAAEILLGNDIEKPWEFIKANINKQIAVESIYPKELEVLPWAGHMGVKLLESVIPILQKSESTLIFTNTRNQTEIWYQKLLEVYPDLAGGLAMHHGSMSKEIRNWVEDALHQGQLKVVVCTSSLDLGVDFRPVETIIQVGSPKGAARFLQRAGRSGHRPGAKSKIYFLPTHSLELVESAALQQAAKSNTVEKRTPFIRSFDVLIQYLVTLAVSDGFKPDEILPEIQSTFSFNSINQFEWNWVLNFITSGGESLHAYDEFHKVIVDQDGLYRVESRRVAQRHRLSIGTIVSDPSLSVNMVSGKRIGTIEESFIASLNEGDTFWMAGQPWEYVRIKGMVVQVRKSKKKSGRTPSWGGGRMPLSTELAEILRQKLHEHAISTDKELQFLRPLFERQKEESIIPNKNQFLLEYYHSEEGYHLLVYPFEGRNVHEGMGALLAYRLGMIEPRSYSIAMNDYGFELLSDLPIPIEIALDSDIFSVIDLHNDIMASINATEMARRRFRDIASISGMVFKGYPGNHIKDKHIQSSSQLFFDVFSDHEPDNLLLIQAFDEVMTFQLEEQRLRNALERIAKQEVVLKYPSKPTPLAFPIMVDRLRERVTTEKLEDRIAKMQLEFD
ncbi:MAG: ligase-associated DNA damage response DEXH box helicase [Bacteroidetes bacterium]|nr:ligase-associated DNA damage response DEXH box helicase [Bacteroidota bacterium]